VANLQIKDLPEDIHDELRRRASRSGMTVRDYVLDLLRRDQSIPSRVEWLESLRQLDPVEAGRPAAELIREQRAARAQVPVVVDASAVVELLLRSPAAAPVEEALVRNSAVAPELLDTEVLSALVALEPGGRVSADGGRAALDVFLAAPITRVPHAPLLREAWERRRNLSPYDAVYVALAHRLRCSLVTGDRHLAGTPGLGITVTLIST
jgi:predicted nucleic acid-binding protein